MTVDATDLVSGEGVRLDLARAGVASRTIAAVIDVAIQAVALLALLTVTAAISDSDTAALQAAIVAEIVLVIAGYPIVLEWATRGRTVGKICLGLRVVRDDGGPIGFRHALVRGLSSLVLEKPGVVFPISTAAGVATLTSSRQQKRIGDFMAGTIVLDERSAAEPVSLPYLYVAPALVPWLQSADLRRLDDTLALQLRQFVGRAYAMTPPARTDLGNRLLALVHAAVTPPPPPGAPVPDVLGGLLAERRRRADAGLATGPRFDGQLGARPAPSPRASTASDEPGFARPE